MVRFSQMPTLGELIKAARKLNWKLAETPGVTGPRGPVRIRYLRRGSDFVDLLETKQSARLTRNSTKSLCRRLGIPLEDYGLEDDEDDDSNDATSPEPRS